jgi:phosphatidylglycerophosphate synthase
MIPARDYSYARSIKSDVSDEIINTYLLRPLAGVLVRLLYRTPVTPNQVTLTAIFFGILSAVCYFSGSPFLTAIAGVLLTSKDLLDSADGQLARAKQMYSRTGRFLDSIGDLLVNFLVFTALTTALIVQGGNAWILFLGAFGFLGITLRVSYHVFYHTSYLHLHGRYALNRLTEEIRAEDYAVDRLTFRLHTIFLWLYGWQDQLMERLDRWCKRGTALSAEREQQWYGDLPALRLSGALGLGTELFILTVCSVLYRLEFYLYVNLLVMNGLWCSSVLYRRYVLAPRLGLGGV